MKCIPIIIALTLVLISCKEKIAHHPKVKENLTIGGSDTEYEVVKLLLENYQENNSDNLKVTGGGSDLGMKQLLRKEIEMANCSRKITQDEIEEGEDKDIKFDEVIFAYDALAIISNSKLKIDSLSTLQLAQIFRGEINNWKQVGGEDLPIHIYGRNKNSGTRRYVKNRFARYEGFSDNYVATSGNKAIIEKVKSDTLSMGFVGVGYIMNEYGMPATDVWAIPIYCEGGQAYSPYETIAVLNKDYDLLRPLYQYVNKKYIDEFSDFINFEVSKSGQDVIKKYGYYRINNEARTINSEAGF